ncbi:MAG: hypothetical protein ACYC0B_02130 [Gemmatimonadaceae bacterium]
MKVPVYLFDLQHGTAADDPAALTLVTYRQQAPAWAIARALVRDRERGLLDDAREFFVVPRDAEVEADGAPAAVAAGYQLRTVLARTSEDEAREAAGEPPAEAPTGSEGGPL